VNIDKIKKKFGDVGKIEMYRGIDFYGGAKIHEENLDGRPV